MRVVLCCHGGVDAHALAGRLDIDLDTTGICLACLSFISMPLVAGNLREARQEVRRIAPDLWAEGLDAPLRAALERARAAGDPDAGEAIRELDLAGGHARIVEPVVERLAQEQCARARTAVERGRTPWPAFGLRPWKSDVYVRDGDV